MSIRSHIASAIGRRATLVMIGIAACSAAAGPVRAAPPGPVVVFGDSLSVGTAGGLKAEGYLVRDLGVVGWGLSKPDVAARLMLLREEAKTAGAVVVLVGANDRANIGTVRFGSREWPAAYGKWLAAVRDAVPAEVPVIWITQPDYRNPDLDAHGKVVTETVRMVAAISGDRTVVPPGGFDVATRAPDGVHFTAQGYRAIAHVVEPLLPSFLATDERHQPVRR